MLPAHLRTACAARRAGLLDRLAGRPAVVFSGLPRPRNYSGNTFPFRANSHFLYLVGAPLEGALLWLDGASATLLVPDPDPHDALWHGALPSLAELSDSLGLEVVPRSARIDALKASQPATLAPFAHDERAALEALLGRGSLATDEPLARALIALRLSHDDAAQSELRRAAEVSVRAHIAGMRATRPGLYERHVCAAMEQAIGAEVVATAYGSIVTVHGEVLHNHAHHQALRDGDLLLADVGAETDTGYAGDITRTWPVSGTYSATQRALYEVVLSAQRAALELVRPGTRYRDVHLAAARKINEGLVALGILEGEIDALTEDGAHALFFPHGIGHLLGLDVHDMEDLGDLAGYADGRARDARFGLSSLRLDRDLAPGMVVTIEPGFYQVPSILEAPEKLGLPGKALNRAALTRFADVRGIRIEDDVLVTEAGHEVLTRALPKTADAIEGLLGER